MRLTTIQPNLPQPNLHAQAVGRERMISAARVGRWQMRHFLLWTVVPLLASCFAVCRAVFYGFSWQEVAILLGMWILTGGLGVSIGYHRHFTHKSFEAARWIRYAMAVCGSMAAQGPVIYWVSIHRRHHSRSDQEGDPHSPRTAEIGLLKSVRAFWNGHMGWVARHDVPSPACFARDLIRDPAIMFINKTYTLWLVAGLLLPGVILALLERSYVGFMDGVLWGGFMRILLGNQIIWGVNSLCHTFGFRDYDTPDGSRNNLLLVVPAFGEGWHNNHHAYPESAMFGHKWWQLDLGYRAIRTLELLGLAWQVRRPARQFVGQSITRQDRILRD